MERKEIKMFEEEAISEIIKRLWPNFDKKTIGKISKEINAEGIRDPIALGCVIAQKVVGEKIIKKRLSDEYCDAAQKALFSLRSCRPKAKKQLYLLWLKSFKNFKLADFKEMFPEETPSSIYKDIERARFLLLKRVLSPELWEVLFKNTKQFKRKRKRNLSLV